MCSTCNLGQKYVSSGWSHGNPSYCQRLIVDGHVVAYATETTALATGALTCRYALSVLP